VLISKVESSTVLISKVESSTVLISKVESSTVLISKVESSTVLISIENVVISVTHTVFLCRWYQVLVPYMFLSSAFRVIISPFYLSLSASQPSSAHLRIITGFTAVIALICSYANALCRDLLMANYVPSTSTNPAA
jgi:hypothetical protein